ncbi:MAG: ABC transporter ATP-binding protein [Sulfurovum sp.]|nr:ABC transporter ATP-binding protein [Sulfurovum sp.]
MQIIGNVIFTNISKMIKDDRKNILHLVYYSMLEAILVLSIPLSSSFVINSVLAHATISVFVLGAIVSIVFVFVTFLQGIKEYIVEKFQQKIFLKSGIEIAIKSLAMKNKEFVDEDANKKLMNYFFDITSIQKIFPVLLLDGVGLVVKIIVSLLLLFVFDSTLFFLGLFFFFGYLIVLVMLGNHGIEYALERSDAKHKAIYFLQHIRKEEGTQNEILGKFDDYLTIYAKARQKSFSVIIKQLMFTFFSEGLIFSVFLIVGGYLVIQGALPLGEFVAAEIVVMSITYALKSFAKQLDYVYDMIEGLYKINKLSVGLEDKNEDKDHEKV